MMTWSLSHTEDIKLIPILRFKIVGLEINKGFFG